VRPRGRLASPRGVYSYEDVTLSEPPEVYLDTSFVAAGGSTVFFSRLLETELAETAFKIALKERFGRQWMRARYDGRARRRAGRLMDETRAAWKEVLTAFAYVRLELDEVADEVPDLMRQFGLASYDAVHVASALYADVGVMVTRDATFALVPSSVLVLFTDSSRVAVCRSRRQR
jgi:predicted nucleic acid-binding protein